MSVFVLVVLRIPIGPQRRWPLAVFAHRLRNGGRLHNLERHTYLARMLDNGLCWCLEILRKLFAEYLWRIWSRVQRSIWRLVRINVISAQLIIYRIGHYDWKLLWWTMSFLLVNSWSFYLWRTVLYNVRHLEMKKIVMHLLMSGSKQSAPWRWLC